MAEKSSFFNSVNGDKKYDASSFAEYFSRLVTSGVFSNPSTNLQLLSNNNFTVTVQTGYGWINGYYYSSDSTKDFTVPAPDGTLNRIDNVVLRWDLTNRQITTVYVEGTLASSPVAPTPTRNDTLYELVLAQVQVNANATSIPQSAITDTRMNNTLCGWVNSLIQADTTTIFNQYEDWFNTTKSNSKQDLVTYGSTLPTANLLESDLHILTDVSGKIELYRYDGSAWHMILSNFAVDITHTNSDGTTDNLNDTVNAKAPLNSPVFTGTPQVNVGGTNQDILNKGNVPVTNYQDNTQVSKFKVTVSTTSLSPNGWFKLPLNTKIKDNQSEFDVTNNRFVAKANGTWLINTRLRHSFNASGVDFKAALYVNGVLKAVIGEETSNAGTSTYSIGGAKIIDLNANDYVEVWYNIGSAGQTFFNAETDTFFEGIRMY